MKGSYGFSTKLKKLLFLLFFVLALVSLCPSSAQAATTAKKNAVKQIIIDMLENCDTTTHNIYSYRITSSELEKIYKEIIDSDYNLLIESYEYNLSLNRSNKGFYVNTIAFSGMNSDVFTLYPKLVTTYNRILSGVDDSMSDLDKIMYFHDAIVEHVLYKNDGTAHVYGSNGALANGVAVCMGYADSLMLLLKSQGIETSYIRQKVTLNHGWIYVKLDGEWYHIDPTWDDTRSPTRGITSRQFLLRNDDEFAAAGKNTHGDYNWSVVSTTEKSTSTRFNDWFVHDIIGKMFYYQGYWYYVDTKTNNIMAAKSDGSDTQIVVNGLGIGAITILSVENNTITYTWGGKNFSISTDPSLWNEEIDFKEFYSFTDTADWNDINSWKSGVYNYQTGYYEANTHRICLNAYYSAVPDSEYTYESSDDSFNMLIREMDENLKMIRSYNLVSGQSFTTTAETVYLAISLYIPMQDSVATYETYKSAFDAQSLIIKFSNPDSASSDDTNSQPIESDTASEDKESESTESESADSETADSEPTESESADSETVDSEPTESESMESQPDESEPADTESTESELITTYWNELALWKSGLYSWIDGKYQSFPSRICLKDYVAASPNITYTVSLSDNLYKLLFRQLDENYNFIKSNIVADQEVFTTEDNCTYLAVSLYSPTLDSKLKYTDYEQLFESGIILGVTYETSIRTGSNEAPTATDSTDDSVVTDEKTDNSVIEGSFEASTSIEKSPTTETTENASDTLADVISWNDFSEWKSGLYHWLTGKYTEYPNRICLNDYVNCNPNEEYVTIVDNQEFHLLVRQLDSSYDIITSHNLANGDTFTTAQNCTYLAISLYSPNSDSSMTYSRFESVFQNGINVGLKNITTITDSDTPLASAIRSNYYAYIVIGFGLMIVILTSVVFAKKQKNL